MSRLLSVILIVAAAFLLAVSMVHAQTGITRERLEGELERTDEAISRAREVVVATNSAAAKLAYDHSVSLQTQAREQYRLGSGPGNGNWEMSLRLTMQARQRASEAIAAGRETEQNEAALQRRLERAQDLLEQARLAVGDSDRQMLLALYESGRRNLDQAWEFYREQQYRAALKLSNQVERTAEKLLQAANRDLQRDQNFKRQTENVRRFIEQVRGQTADCAQLTAAPLLQQAEQAQLLARQAEEEGSRQAALRSLQSARELADQALRECTGDQNLSRRYERLMAQADRLNDEVNPGDQAARILLNQAREQLKMARGYIEGDQSQAAAAALKAAQLSLDEAQRRAQSQVQ